MEPLSPPGATLPFPLNLVSFFTPSPGLSSLAQTQALFETKQALLWQHWSHCQAQSLFSRPITGSWNESCLGPELRTRTQNLDSSPISDAKVLVSPFCICSSIWAWRMSCFSQVGVPWPWSPLNSHLPSYICSCFGSKCNALTPSPHPQSTEILPGPTAQLLKQAFLSPQALLVPLFQS